MTKRVAVYARVSTTRQAENDISIPDQLAQAKRYCKAKGWHVIREFVGAGASARDDKRPEFRSLMDAACVDPSPFDVVLVHSQSRFFRDTAGYVISKRCLHRCACRPASHARAFTGALARGLQTSPRHVFGQSPAPRDVAQTSQGDRHGDWQAIQGSCGRNGDGHVVVPFQSQFIGDRTRGMHPSSEFDGDGRSSAAPSAVAPTGGKHRGDSQRPSPKRRQTTPAPLCQGTGYRHRGRQGNCRHIRPKGCDCIRNNSASTQWRSSQFYTWMARPRGVEPLLQE